MPVFKGIFIGGLIFLAEVTPAAGVMSSDKVDDVDSLPLGPYYNGGGGVAGSQLKARDTRELRICRFACWCGRG